MDDTTFNAVAASIPPGSRYRLLLRKVLERLPVGWDRLRQFCVLTADGTPASGYACSYRFEETELDWGERADRISQIWEVTLFPGWLNRLSDDAVKWVIAHECGHIASGCACGVFVDGRLQTRVYGTDEWRDLSEEEAHFNEKMANAIARAWAFWDEEDAFIREEPTLHT
jgi:hypothetical protein